MHDIMNKLGWGLAGALAVALVAALAGVISAGPLDPPAAPAPTDRTRITSLPATISVSGSYVVTANLTCPTCTNGVIDGITVSADNVTIDLNGFTLTGTDIAGDNGIDVSVATNNLVVKNGTIRDWGIGVNAANATNGQFYDLQVNSNVTGLSFGSNGLVRYVVATENTGDGIEQGGATGGFIRDSIASSNGQNGINVHDATTVLNNVANFNTVDGINVSNIGSHIEGNNVSRNSVYGIDTHGGGNVVVRNSAGCNLVDDYLTQTGDSSGPDEGPSGLPATLPGNSAANIVFRLAVCP